MKKVLFIILLLDSLCLAQSNVRRFGIFSPVLGLREDVPSITLNEAFTEDNENVLLRYGEIHRSRMRTKIMINATDDPCIVPDGNPILAYHWFEKSDGTDFLLAFTKAHVYYWDTGVPLWKLKFTCGSDCTEWSVCTFRDNVYATNNVDKVQTWDGTGNFAVLDHANGLDTGSNQYITLAKFIHAFEDYLLVGNVTLAGATYPQNLYWCDKGDATNWASGNAGNMTVPGPDPLLAAEQINDFLLVFTGRSMDALWLVDSTLIFNRRRFHNSMGTYSPGSIVRDINERVYFIDNHKNIRRINSVMSSVPSISKAIDKTMRQIPDSLIADIRSTYVWDYDQIWWAIPYGPEATTNDKVLCLDATGSWTKRDMPVSAFGEFEQKTVYTWVTIVNILGEGTDTWDDWSGAWNSAEPKADYRFDICGDYSGWTYNAHYGEQEDAGSSFTSYAVLSTDFSQQKGSRGLLYYKRLLKMTFFFYDEGGGTADIHIKRDMERTWQSAGSVSLDGSTDILWRDLNCDYRARHFLVKISAANPFRFIGMIFDYVPAGLR